MPGMLNLSAQAPTVCHNNELQRRRPAVKPKVLANFSNCQTRDDGILKA